jgi:hypothetical protein
MKRRVAYDKPSVKRKRKQAAARKKRRKAMRRMQRALGCVQGVYAQQVHDQIARALKASAASVSTSPMLNLSARPFSIEASRARRAARCDDPSVACVRALQSDCRGEHRQGVPPSRNEQVFLTIDENHRLA